MSSKSKTTSVDKMIHVATYGTLKGMDRTGQGWKSALGAKFLGHGLTTYKNFTMHGGGFPIVNRSNHGQKGKVLAEIYLIPERSLGRLDAYEGAPDFYKSELISFDMINAEFQSCVALMYLGGSVNDSLKGRPIIEPINGILHWPYPAEHPVDTPENG